MKNLALGLALGTFAVLPACTVHNHYHGTDPNNGSGSGSTSINGSGTTGGGSYGYSSSSSAGSGGTRSPQGNTGGNTSGGNGGNNGGNGGIRNGGGGGNGGNNGGNGGIRNGGGGGNGGGTGGVRSNGNAGTTGGGYATAPPVRGGSGPGRSSGQPAAAPPVKTGGIASPSAPGAGATPAPGGIRTGGTKGVRNADGPGSASSGADVAANTGGTKGPGRVRDLDAPATVGVAGGTKQNQPADEQPLVTGTGGVKPPRNVPNDGGGEMPVQPTRTAEEPTVGTIKGPGKERVPAFVLTKFACMGACPSYVATVWANGRVRYEGQSNVPRLGTHELRLDPAVVAQLLQQARDLGFGELPDHYASGATDIPATSLAIFGNGRAKTVTVEDNAPEAVNTLFGNVAAAIGQVAGSSLGENRSDER